jgi:glucose/arabinose dehydrogenase
VCATIPAVSGRARCALAAVVVSGVAGAVAMAGSGAEGSGRGAAKGRKGVRLHAMAHFNAPTFVAAPRNSRKLVFVVERAGRIRILNGEKKGPTFLDIRGLVGCCEAETGLFSIAFAPDYARARKFYVYFTNNQRNIEIDQFKRSNKSPAQANRGSRRKIIEIKQTGPVNHNGGTVAIAPNGLLYAATGDGGNYLHPARRAPQSKGSLLGKLIRIDPRPGKRRPYRIPRSNPYVGKRGRDQIYARGLRNPFRFSIDRRRILIADVGENRREEVDMKPLRKASGANFGWPIFEGTLRFRPGHIAHETKPVLQYPHTGGACAITGGVVIRDKRLRGLYGRYVYGDYCTGEIRTFRPRKGHARKDRALRVRRANGPVAFGEDGRGRISSMWLSSTADRCQGSIRADGSESDRLARKGTRPAGGNRDAQGTSGGRYRGGGTAGLPGDRCGEDHRRVRRAVDPARGEKGRARRHHQGAQGHLPPGR